MEAELASYAKAALQQQKTQQKAVTSPTLAVVEDNDTIAAATVDESIVSIEDRIISFDGVAAQQTLAYVRQGIQEMNPFQQCGVSMSSSHTGAGEDSGSDYYCDDDDDDEGLSSGQRTPQHENWLQQQQQQQPDNDEECNIPTERTPLFRQKK